MIWDKTFLKQMGRAIRIGGLALTMPDGSLHHFGTKDGPQAAVHLHDPALPRKILLNPELAMGEAYVDQSLTIADDDLHGFLRLITRNAAAGNLPAVLRHVTRLRKGIKWLAEKNPLPTSRANVAHHYDIGPDLYDLFLDASKQYSCAYFVDPDWSLEQAQQAKLTHIARKLCLKPGQQVLEIGCGFGTLAVMLARDYGVQVTGITLSQVQLAEALSRSATLPDNRPTFRLQDYREVTGTYDRIVSVGMMEHVGRPQLPRYFATIADLLAPDGIALVHTIGRSSPPSALSPWFQKYIFPGGYAPAFSEVIPHIERTGLVMADLEVWRGHYERTLQHWQRRFGANLDQVRALYDDRFIRMWRYYLVNAELSFTEMHQVVFQIQLSNGRLTVPMTRDYLYSPTPGLAG